MWVGIVVLAAGEEPGDSQWVGVPSLGGLFAALVALVMGVGLVVAVLLLLSMIFSRQEAIEVPERKPVWPFIVVAVLVVIAFSRLDRGEPVEIEVEVPPTTQLDTEVDVPGTPTIAASELGVVLIAIVLSVVLVAWSRRRLGAVATPDDGDDSSFQDRLVPIVDEAANQLELGNDPRSAVMVAYAGVEGALAELGHPPQPTETPTEYLTRILSEVIVDPAPLIDLARLHELARFSNHLITEGDKWEAAAALRRVRSELSRVG